MENQPTTTGLRKALDTVVSFVRTYSILSFVLFLLAIFLAFIAIPSQIENSRLNRENALMRELLRPDCPGDSIGR